MRFLIFVGGKVGFMDESLPYPAIRHDKCSLLLSHEDHVVQCMICTSDRLTTHGAKPVKPKPKSRNITLPAM